MSGLNRFMDVLRLYTVESYAWTVQAMSDALGTPASSIYRVVGELVRAGLLEATAGSQYRLGAAFVEFDRLTRLTDPLIRLGRSVLHDIVVQAHTPCVGLLCRLYNTTVMCIADDAAGQVDFRSSYERGRPMPLIRGATSKVILAQLPSRRLAALLQSSTAEFGPAAGDGVDPFRAALLDIRRRGFAVTRGEIDAGLVGLATPLTCQPLGLVASLSLVVRADDIAEDSERRLILMLVSAASMLTDALVRDAGQSATGLP